MITPQAQPRESSITRDSPLLQFPSLVLEDPPERIYRPGIPNLWKTSLAGREGNLPHYLLQMSAYVRVRSDDSSGRRDEYSRKSAGKPRAIKATPTLLDRALGSNRRVD